MIKMKEEELKKIEERLDKILNSEKLWEIDNDEIIDRENKNPSTMKCPKCGEEANKNFIARCDDGKIIGFCWQCYHCGYNSWKESMETGFMRLTIRNDNNQINNFKVWKTAGSE